MKTIKDNLGTIFLALVMVILFECHTAAAANATPELVLTWKAQGYTPNHYTGRVFPTQKSFMALSAEVVVNGKIIDTSRVPLYWYLDNEFIEGGPGKKNTLLFIDKFPGSILEIRLEIPNYQGEPVSKTIEIPVITPEVVIETPFPRHIVTTPTITLQATPYFFLIKDPRSLSYAWEVNNEPPLNTENPHSLVINIPSDAKEGVLAISVQANSSQDTIPASNRTTLNFLRL